MIELILYAQNDQSIRELSDRFGFDPFMSTQEMQGKLKEKEEEIRKQILTELKIKEGAEKIRRAAGDTKHVNSQIKWFVS